MEVKKHQRHLVKRTTQPFLDTEKNTFVAGRSYAGSVMFVFIPTGICNVVWLFNLGQPLEPAVRSCQYKNH